MIRWLVVGVSLSLSHQPASRNPEDEAFRVKAPEDFRVVLQTTQGDIVVALHCSRSPSGVDRFFQLVKLGFCDDVAFFRVVEGAWAQFGIHGDPEIAQIWREATIPDDPVRETNSRGRLTYAHGFAPDDRTTQLFINLRDNPRLDEQGFSPIGEVVAGMEVAGRALFGLWGSTKFSVHPQTLKPRPAITSHANRGVTVATCSGRSARRRW